MSYLTAWESDENDRQDLALARLVQPLTESVPPESAREDAELERAATKKPAAVKFETYRLLFRSYEKQRKEIDAAWAMLESCYDVEPREYFEREAPRNGFGSALAQAVFHIHKRDKR